MLHLSCVKLSSSQTTHSCCLYSLKINFCDFASHRNWSEWKTSCRVGQSFCFHFERRPGENEDEDVDLRNGKFISNFFPFDFENSYRKFFANVVGTCEDVSDFDLLSRSLKLDQKHFCFINEILSIWPQPFNTFRELARCKLIQKSCYVLHVATKCESNGCDGWISINDDKWTSIWLALEPAARSSYCWRMKFWSSFESVTNFDFGSSDATKDIRCKIDVKIAVWWKTFLWMWASYFCSCWKIRLRYKKTAQKKSPKYFTCGMTTKQLTRWKVSLFLWVCSMMSENLRVIT